ncbi:MAG: cupredoxin domain-containing protein [Actinobacteria bacterium]|nr:cupredoxin domain-containing protein [Actinomycetota bacterium]
MRIRSKLIVTASLAAGLVLSACSGSDEPAAVDTAGETTDDAVGEDGDDTPMGDDGLDHADDEAMGEAMGEAADASEATRTISVEAFDMAFDPETISVEPGEVVTFEVTNTGEAAHEFFLGDGAMQQEHAEEMAGMDSDMAHDEPYSIRLDPDETKELTWRFAESGEVEFACHEPGHYQAGMHGQITVG